MRFPLYTTHQSRNIYSTLRKIHTRVLSDIISIPDRALWNRLKDDRSVYSSNTAQECSVPRPSPDVSGFSILYYAIILGIIRQMPATLRERKRSEDRVVSLLRQQPPGRLFRRRCHPRWQICQLDRLGQLSLSFPPKFSDSWICWKCMHVGPRLPKSTVKSAHEVRIWEPAHENRQRIIHAFVIPL